MTVDFSIVLVNFDSAGYVKPCLDWIEKQRFSGTFEVIVVNNRSTDGSLEMLRERDDIRLLDPGRNLGYSAGNNLAIAEATGRYILCLNFDCLITDEFLQHVYDAFEADAGVGMIAGKLRKLVDMRGTMYLDSTGIDFTTLIPADRGEWQYDCSQYDSARDIFGPSGAAACYRREALEQVAYAGRCCFDEQMFTYCEDIDLAWRLNLAGWRGLYVPQALAFHERGATRRDSFWKKVGYFATGFSNRHFTMLKNLRWREDVKGRLGKLISQEWRFLSSWCGRRPGKWALACFSMARLAWLALRPSFFSKRRLATGGSSGRDVSLSLDTDFWQISYERRRREPVSGAAKTAGPAETVVDRRGWLAETLGFSDVTWGGDCLMKGTAASADSCIELHLPESSRDALRQTVLQIEIESAGNITGNIQVCGPSGRWASSDWFLLDGGTGTYAFDLETMNLEAGADNVRIWSGPWEMMRLRLTGGAGSKIGIRRISFLRKGAVVTNAEVNTEECGRLPAVLESKPILVYAEISTLCNLHCSMCGRSVHGVDPSSEGLMGRDVFERLSEVFTPGGSLALFGRGETLLHPEFTEFLRIAKEHGMHVCFNSNAKALSRSIAEAMVRYGQDSLTISCSAGTPGTYEAVHCGGTWERLWRNISGLQEARRAHGDVPGTKPALYLEFVSQMRNIAELPSLVRRAIEWDMNGVLVIDLVAHSDELERQRMNVPEHIQIAEKYYKEALAVCREYRDKRPHFELRLPALYDAVTKKSTPETVERTNAALREAISANTDTSTSGHFCLEPWQTFYARFDGTVAPCVITNRSLGDLNKEGALEIWNGLLFRKFRERMRSEDKPYECLRCHLFPGPQRYDKALENVSEYAPL